jgi:hypothetical protein
MVTCTEQFMSNHSCSSFPVKIIYFEITINKGRDACALKRKTPPDKGGVSV